MKTFKELETLVVQWGKERDLYCTINGATSDSQRLKFFEEIGELAEGFIKKDSLLIKDAIGDLQVVSLHISFIDNEDLSPLGNENVINRIRDYYKTGRKEFSELSVLNALSKFCVEKLSDSGYDRFAFLEAVSAELGYDRLECLEHAYNEIKDREGKMINRVFVKDA